MLDSADTDTAAAVLVLARTARAFALLRAVDLEHGRPGTVAPPPAAEPEPEPPPAAAPRRPWNWRTWQPSTRMALQVTVGTALAATVGELISASRWYWAVLTAFLVFLGTTSRAAIVTRAYRRVLGTLVGGAVGVGIVLLAHHEHVILLAVCAACVFGMLYFGSLTYALMATFVTVLVLSMYALMGLFDRQVIVWRLDETAAGALIGVCCAFLIVPTGSLPELAKLADGYLGAVGGAIDAAVHGLTTAGERGAVLAAAARLDQAQREVLASVPLMATGLSGAHRGQARRASQHMRGATLAGDHLLQCAAQVTGSPGAQLDGAAAAALSTAADHVRANMKLAERGLRGRIVYTPDPSETTVLDALADVHYPATAPQVEAVLALSRLNWAVLRMARSAEG